MSFRNIRVCYQLAIIVLLPLWGVACVSQPVEEPPSRVLKVQPVEPGFTPSDELAKQINRLKTTRQVRDKILRLHHPDPVERAWAAYQLAKLGRGAAPGVPFLIKMLSDDTPVLLSRYLGGGFHSSSDTTPAQEASRALAKIGEPAIEALTKASVAEDENVRRLAIKSLGQIGSIQSIQTLVEALSDQSRRVQAAAAIALGSYRHPIASQNLMEAFALSNPQTRVHLVYALSQINDIIAVPFLVQQIDQQEVEVKAAIALALGKLRDARAVPTLLNVVNDSDEIVRANAAYALGSFYTPEVINTLIKMLDDPVQRVREAAAEALSQLTGLRLGTDQQKWMAWWQMQTKAMSKDKKAQ